MMVGGSFPRDAELGQLLMTCGKLSSQVSSMRNRLSDLHCSSVKYMSGLQCGLGIANSISSLKQLAGNPMVSPSPYEGCNRKKMKQKR